MAGAKLIVMYPTPKDMAAFEHAYGGEHLAMAAPAFAAAGATKVVLTKTSGGAPFHRMAEIHFPSMQVLQACASSQSGRAVLDHAASISNGGPTIVMTAEEEVVALQKT